MKTRNCMLLQLMWATVCPLLASIRIIHGPY